MINNGQARELLNAIEDYGDRERNLGREFQRSESDQSRHGILAERHHLAIRALNDVKRLLQPFLDDPEGPEGLFDVPDRDLDDQNDYADQFEEVKWWTEE